MNKRSQTCIVQGLCLVHVLPEYGFYFRHLLGVHVILVALRDNSSNGEGVAIRGGCFMKNDDITGLENNLNVPFGQAALKFCLPWAHSWQMTCFSPCPLGK